MDWFKNQLMMLHLNQMEGPALGGFPDIEVSVFLQDSGSNMAAALGMLELVSRSEDKLCHVTVFRWLLDNGHQEQLLGQTVCPSLEVGSRATLFFFSFKRKKTLV